MRLRVFLLSWLLVSVLAAAEPTSLTSAIRFFQEQKLPEARAAFEKLVSAESDNAEANYWLGRTLIAMHDPEAAEPYLEKAVAIDSNCARYIHVLGDAYGLSVPKAGLLSKYGLGQKCLAAYNKAVALDPDDVAARRSRFEYYWVAPRFAGGGLDKAATEAAEIEKRDPVLGGSLRAELRANENKIDEAFSIMTDLARHYPDSKLVQYQIGRLAAVTRQNLDEGAVALKRYLAYSPKDGEPTLWAAHWWLARIFDAKDDRKAARSEYEETLRLSPTFDQARDALRRLPQ